MGRRKATKKNQKTVAGAMIAKTAEAHDKPAIVKRVREYPPAVASAMSKLPVRWRHFVLAYVGKAKGNAALAAKLAGIPHKSYAGIASKAHTLVHHPDVRHAIEQWMQAYALSASELTYKITDLANANMGPFVKFQPDGSLKVRVLNDDEWEAHKHWIKALKCDAETGQVTEVILHDASASQREMAKILKLYSDQPIFLVQQYMQRLSDEDLLRMYQIARTAKMKEEQARFGLDRAKQIPSTFTDPNQGGTADGETDVG